MQLWSRFAQYPPTQPQQQPPPVGAPHPHYSTSPRASTSSVSSLLSGKHASSYPSPSSPTLDPATPTLTSSNELPTPQQALLASMASQALLQRLGSAFWQAFTTQTDAGAPAWDADKIRRVLEGNAVLSIVDVEPEADVRAAPVSSPTLTDDATTHESSKGCSVTTVLEEGMRALSLSKN